VAAVRVCFRVRGTATTAAPLLHARFLMMTQLCGLMGPESGISEQEMKRCFVHSRMLAIDELDNPGSDLLSHVEFFDAVRRTQPPCLATRRKPMDACRVSATHHHVLLFLLPCWACTVWRLRVSCSCTVLCCGVLPGHLQLGRVARCLHLPALGHSSAGSAGATEGGASATSGASAGPGTCVGPAGSIGGGGASRAYPASSLAPFGDRFRVVLLAVCNLVDPSSPVFVNDKLLAVRKPVEPTGKVMPLKPPATCTGTHLCTVWVVVVHIVVVRCVLAGPSHHAPPPPPGRLAG
jgi:hypothetical protein